MKDIKYTLKLVLLFLAFLINLINVNATAQHPDYVVEGSDTIPILYHSPFEQYLQLIDSRKIIHTDQEYFSTNCYRGYVAYWEFSNDSLFLIDLKSCPSVVSKQNSIDMSTIFGKPKQFAFWYSGTIFLANSKIYMEGYYLSMKILNLNQGLVESSEVISNEENIEQSKLDKIFYNKIDSVGDTLFYYIKENLNWEKLLNQYCDCAESYILSYDSSGTLIDAKYDRYYTDEDTFWDKYYEWRLDKKCSKKIRSALQSFSLSYLNPSRDFKLDIYLGGWNDLELVYCRLYMPL